MIKMEMGKNVNPEKYEQNKEGLVKVFHPLYEAIKKEGILIQ